MTINDGGGVLGRVAEREPNALHKSGGISVVGRGLASVPYAYKSVNYRGYFSCAVATFDHYQ